MEPITAITTALALGAAAGLKETAETILKDAYTALKNLIKHKFPKTSPDLEHLEQAPEFQDRQAAVEKALAKEGAADDLQLLQAVKALLDLIQEHAPTTASMIGVDLADIQAGALRISDIVSTGSAVKVQRADIKSDIEIRGIHAGALGDQLPNA